MSSHLQLAVSWAPLPIFPLRRLLHRRPAGGTSTLRSVPCSGSPASCISCCNTSASLSTADGGGSGEQPERCSRFVFFWSRRCEANTGAISPAFTEKLKFRWALGELRFLQGRLSSGLQVGPVQMNWPPSCYAVSQNCNHSSCLCPRNSTQQTACVSQSQPCRQVRTLSSRPASKKRTGPCPGSGEYGRAVPCCSKGLKTKRLRSPQRLHANLIEERSTATEMTTVIPYPEQ